MTTEKRPKRTAALLLGAVLGIGIILYLVLNSRVNPATNASEDRKANVDRPKTWASSVPPVAQVQEPAEAVALRPAAKPPVIDGIEVEKTEVCEGEENLVTIRAHTVDDSDDHLHYVVGTQRGRQIPLRIWGTSESSDYLGTMPKVLVFGRDNAMAEAPLPPFKVKRCGENFFAAEITARLMPNSEAEFELKAQVREVRPKGDQGAAPSRFVPVRYRWTFGDGTTAETTESGVMHAFEPSDPPSMFSERLVRVDIVDAAGKEVSGRLGLEVPDPTYENWAERGVVTLIARATPRFPELGDDGVVRQRFRLSHRSKVAVRIERARVIRARMGPRNSPADEVEESVSTPVSLVPPGAGTEISMELDTRKDTDTFALTYLLEGKTEDGHPARGSFALMRPPAKPTKESNIPVTDAALAERIKKARAILGKPFVTDEDIWQLQREGKL